MFVNNVTTPAYVAANAATGAAVISVGCFAAIVIIGGAAFCIAELQDDSCVFIPCNVAKRFNSRDLVRPCVLGLDICNRQQMLDFLSRCRSLCPTCECPKPTAKSGAPKSETMARDAETAAPTAGAATGYNPDPDQFVRIDQIPMAIPVEAVPAPAPSAPSIEMMQRDDRAEEAIKGQGNRLGLA